MRKIITKQWLKKIKACCPESDMDKAHAMKDVKKICSNALLKENRFNDANWLITRILTKKLCMKYAIYAAKQVLYIFEKKYPNDKRPREAIKAAEKYLKNPTQNNKNAADAAAADAADADAAYAADADAYAADAAYAAYAAAVKTKIIKYGIKLIYKE